MKKDKDTKAKETKDTEVAEKEVAEKEVTEKEAEGAETKESKEAAPAPAKEPDSIKGTVFKAIAFIVSAVLIANAISTGFSSFADAEMQIAAYKAEIESYRSGNGGGIEGGLDSLFDDTSSGGSSEGGAEGGAEGGEEGAAPVEPQQQLTKDEFIKLFNEETAKAANGTYKVKRSGTFVKPINVGNATDALNSIIKGVDKNADLNSVVGGFIGVKSAPIEGTATNGKYEGFEAKYALKGASLTAADITDFAVSPNGTQYAFQIGNVRNPDANSALAHVTNDYITFAEVNKGISDSVGSAVKVEEGGSTANYTKIAFVVTVVDGKITKITYSYTLAATLKIKLAVISATGTGEADIKGEITDIKY